MRFSVSSQSSLLRPLRLFSKYYTEAPDISSHPAMSLTNPRSSRRLSILCCIPVLTFPACSSHRVCRTSGSFSSSDHLNSGRSPRAKVCSRRMHCRPTTCRDLDHCRNADMAPNCTAVKTLGHVKMPASPRLPRWNAPSRRLAHIHEPCSFPDYLRIRTRHLHLSLC